MPRNRSVKFKFLNKESYTEQSWVKSLKGDVCDDINMDFLKDSADQSRIEVNRRCSIENNIYLLKHYSYCEGDKFDSH